MAAFLFANLVSRSAICLLLRLEKRWCGMVQGFLYDNIAGRDMCVGCYLFGLRKGSNVY